MVRLAMKGGKESMVGSYFVGVLAACAVTLVLYLPLLLLQLFFRIRSQKA